MEHETATNVAVLREEDLATVVTYPNVQGETWVYPRWRQLLHQAIHATQRRRDVAAALTRFGHSPGWLDFLSSIDEHAAPTG